MTAGSRRVTRGKQYYLHIVLFGSPGMVFVYAQDCWLGRTLGGTHTVTSSLPHTICLPFPSTLADPSPHGAAPPRLLVRPQNLSGEPLLHSPSDELLLPRAAARVAGRAGRVQISLQISLRKRGEGLRRGGVRGGAALVCGGAAPRRAARAYG